MSRFAVIIPAAGQSSRFVGFEQKKPFVELHGIPIWQRTVEQFVGLQEVVEIVLVMADEDRATFEETFASQIHKLETRIVTGGETRAHSVRNGLNSLQSNADFVAVHDAARPLVTTKELRALFEYAIVKESVIPGVPVTSTVKRVSEDGTITETIDRSPLRLAQTPQVFRRSLLQEAYDQASDPATFTDEASLVEASGHPVFVVPGWPHNIKITTAEDFDLAEMLLSRRAN